MGLVEHDYIVQTLAAYRTDASFAIWVLPRRPWCNQDFLDAHVLDTRLEVVAIDAVAVAEKKTRGFFVGEGVDDLLRGP
jgi:hypothetical protein